MLTTSSPAIPGTSQFRRVVVPAPIQAQAQSLSTNINTNTPNAANSKIQAFRHQQQPATSTQAQDQDRQNHLNCIACRTYHAQGSCPLKRAGVEKCNLCGMAHFGQGRVCPHLQSETQVRAMLASLQNSQEPAHLVAEARKYLKGLKGNLVQLKKQKLLRENAAREAEAANANVNQHAHMGLSGSGGGGGRGGYAPQGGFGVFGSGMGGQGAGFDQWRA